MKTISNEYKEQLRALGKEIDSIITIGETELTAEQINSANLHYESNILKSVMKQLDLILVDPLEKGVELNYKFGIKVGDTYEYIDYGTFIVYQCDKLEDTDTYQIKCYDKMLYSMTDYEDLNITYPVTIKNYLQAICTKLGLTLKDDDFANQDKEIQQELYLDSDGNSLGYKFRDVLDEIAQATGSTICINDNDELEVRYINDAIKESESVSGTSFELESEEAPLNIDQFDGKTTQETTTGKSLLNFATLTNSNTTYTFTNDVLTIVGNSTGTYTRVQADITDLVKNNGGKKLRFDFDKYTTQVSGIAGVNLAVQTSSGTTYPTLVNPSGTSVNYYSIPSDTSAITKAYIRFMPNNTSTAQANTLTFTKPMLYFGTTKEDYEPYTGAKPSPSPTFPQEVVNVSGLQEICLVGKNLANINDVVIGKTWSGANNTNRGTILHIPVKTHQNYTLVSSYTNTHITNIRLVFNYGANDTSSNMVPTSFPWSSGNFNYASIEILADTTFTSDMLNGVQIMLCEGSATLEDYEPYKGKNYDINLGDIELCKIGDYQDKIYKDNGKWYLHKEIGKVVLNGTNYYTGGTTGTNAYYIETNITTLSDNSKVLTMSNMFQPVSFNNRVNGLDATYSQNGKAVIRTANNTTIDWSNATKRTNWLNANTPTLYYVLANPTTTEITNDNYPELYSQLKAIEKARTLEGLTYIDSSVPISFEYIKEYETIDEELVKNTRASFEDVYGPINSIVLSRSADSDNVYLQDEASIEENGLHELKISDNQILNSNDRSDYLPELLDRLDGLMYNLNDYESIGITYLDLCDRYKVSLRGNKYTCIMFNDEIEVNNGLNEIIYTEMPQETETDYSKADKTDRRINQTTLIVDKQQGIIESLVEKVVDVSNTISGTGSITLENAHAGNLHYLSIKGNISQLFASDTTYPSNTTLPIGPTLLIDSTEYTLDIDRLRYINNTICDEFIYQDGECYIIRRVDINGNALASEVIEPRQGIILQVEESSTISLKSFNNAIFKCEYLLENVYTDNFASQVDVKSSITQTENMIAEKVEAVADENGNVTSGSIILAINKDESTAGIQADKIKLEGYTTINDGFSVDLEGNMKAKSGDVGGWKINESGLDNGNQFIHNNGYSNIYTYADMVTIRNYLLGNIDLTQNDITHYDLNGDGVVDLADYILMRKMILGEDTEEEE